MIELICPYCTQILQKTIYPYSDKEQFLCPNKDYAISAVRDDHCFIEIDNNKIIHMNVLIQIDNKKYILFTQWTNMVSVFEVNNKSILNEVLSIEVNKVIQFNNITSLVEKYLKLKAFL